MSDSEGVSVADCEPVCVALGVPVELSVAAPLPVTDCVCEGVCVAVGVSACDVVPDKLTVPELEDVDDTLAVRLCVKLRVCVSD